MLCLRRQDYKVDPGGAQPYATISMYADLVESKDLGLIRADITPNLTKKVMIIFSCHSWAHVKILKDCSSWGKHVVLYYYIFSRVLAMERRLGFSNYSFRLWFQPVCVLLVRGKLGFSNRLDLVTSQPTKRVCCAAAAAAVDVCQPNCIVCAPFIVHSCSSPQPNSCLRHVDARLH